MMLSLMKPTTDLKINHKCRAHVMYLKVDAQRVKIEKDKKKEYERKK